MRAELRGNNVLLLVPEERDLSEKYDHSLWERNGRERKRPTTKQPTVLYINFKALKAGLWHTMTKTEMNSGTATNPIPPASAAIAAEGVSTKGVAAAAATMPAVLGMDSILVPKALIGEDGILKLWHDTTSAINTIKNIIRVMLMLQTVVSVLFNVPIW